MPEITGTCGRRKGKNCSFDGEPCGFRKGQACVGFYPKGESRTAVELFGYASSRPKKD